jgi:lipopolysaccharide/colanic/teichoic acid biosynthesis glycosyltransferase
VHQSIALLAMLIPVLLLIALGIKCTSPGPVLFRQRRHGYNNREFDLLKFRSMRSRVDRRDRRPPGAAQR